MTSSSSDGWHYLLVGHQWPNSSAETTLDAAATNRGEIAAAFETYSGMLASVRNGALGSQEGVTADDARAAFQVGEEQSRDLASRNLTKKAAYSSAAQSVSALRAELSEIADRGKAEIEAIQSSRKPAAVKTVEITAAVLKAQAEANVKAAAHCENVYSAIQQALGSSNTDMSSRAFAKSNGVDLDRAFGSPPEERVRDQVNSMLSSKNSSADLFSKNESAQNPPLAGTSTSPSPFNSQGALFRGSEDAHAPQLAGGHASAGNGTPNLFTQNETLGTADGSFPTATGQMPSTTIPAMGTQMPSAGAATPPKLASPSAPSLSSTSAPTNALSPEGFAQNFNNGAQAGNPVSAGTEALSNTASHAMQPQTPMHPESMAAPPMAPTAPTAGAPLFETAHAAPTYDAPQAPAAPQPDTTQAYVAAPAAQAPVMPSTAAPAAPQGPLPAYGADLRPPAATAPASPPAMPTAAAPGSAPVHPSAGTQLNQPAVVRQAPTAAGTAAPAPAGLTENAVAATTTGAMAGASAAQTQAQQRLSRLLDAVARQEPKLRWAIGDREDGNTVLATDLASGWIPPHVEIPTGIKLLKPRSRSRTLDALLGETTLTAAYAPGQYLPPAEDAQPTSMSIRARDTDDVEDLGWELSQATKWRDGLPRLAHTLAKAASTGTGYLDSEVELLREHLATVEGKVLGDYPDHVDTANVGNWQLLATIDALIKGEKTAANYHFAWFQALNLALKGEVHR